MKLFSFSSRGDRYTANLFLRKEEAVVKDLVSTFGPCLRMGILLLERQWKGPILLAELGFCSCQ